MNTNDAQAAFTRALATERQAFGDFFLTRLLGLDIRYEGQACVVRFDAKDFLFNPQGTLHGGIMATVLDISMGHLLQRTVGPGATLEMKVQYLRPASAGPLVCKGEFTQQGRSVSFLRSTLSDAQDQTVAFATATWKLLRATTASNPIT